MKLRMLFFSAEERIGRRTFWFGYTVVMALNLALHFINLVGVPSIIGNVLVLATLWPQICIEAKRLHDMGRTAWSMAVPALVGIICLTIGFVLEYSETGQAGHEAIAPLVVAGVCAVVYLIWIGLTPGTSEPNQFGPALNGAGE
jgi:uncharacterized membrane protein YhaH (DUF805 family)